MERLKTTLVYLLPAALLVPGIAYAAVTPCTIFNLIVKAKDVFAAVVGVFAILTVLYSAFLFMIGAGSEETTKKAKTFLLFGLVGIAVALFAFVAVESVAKLLGITEQLERNCPF